MRRTAEAAQVVVGPGRGSRDRLGPRYVGLDRGAYRVMSTVDQADLDRVERFAGHSPAGVLRTEPAPPQARGIPLEPEYFKAASDLINLKSNRYALGDVPCAIYIRRGEKK